MADPLRLVFLGSDPIALPLLNWLADEGRADASLVAIFTGPDRPAGRGQSVRPNPIKAWATGRAMGVFQPEKPDEAARQHLAALGADVSLVVAYGHLLRDPFIATPRLGTLNLHASLLPAYRGASPIQSAVASGDPQTGMSLMRIVREMDAGPVADFEPVPIDRLDTSAEVDARLAQACVPLLARALPRLAAGSLSFADQDPSKASYCRKLVKEDGRLDFRSTAAVLASRINGLFPWPGASAEIENEPIKFGLADALSTPPSAEPGTILGRDEAGLMIAAGSGTLRILRLQRPGGRMLPAPEFLRGFPFVGGAVLPSLPMAALVAPSPFRK